MNFDEIVNNTKIGVEYIETKDEILSLFEKHEGEVFSIEEISALTVNDVGATFDRLLVLCERKKLRHVTTKVGTYFGTNQTIERVLDMVGTKVKNE